MTTTTTDIHHLPHGVRRRTIIAPQHSERTHMGTTIYLRWVLVAGILCCNQSTSREESQRWSRRVPKRRTTSRMPEA